LVANPVVIKGHDVTVAYRFTSGAELAMAFAAAERRALPDVFLRRARKLGHHLTWTEPELAAQAG